MTSTASSGNGADPTRAQSPYATSQTTPNRSRSSSTASSNGLPPTFDALAPQRAPTTRPAEEVLIPIPGIAPSTSSAAGPSRLGPVPCNAEDDVAVDASTLGQDVAAQPLQGEGGVRLHVDAGPGCGGIAWPAGEVLSRYMAYRHEVDPNFLKGKNVLELGSGTGLVGLAVGLLERTVRVEVTDQAVLLDLMQRNIQLNYPNTSSPSLLSSPPSPSPSSSAPADTTASSGLNPTNSPTASTESALAPPALQPQHDIPNVVASELNWGEPLPRHIKVDELDMILAADCVYFEPAFPLLLTTLLHLSPLPPSKPVPIYFCWKKRRKADKRFFGMLKKHFDSKHVEDDRPGARGVYAREGVSLLLLTRRR